MASYAIFEPTPPEAVELLKPFLTGKVVMELGAGDGKFAFALKPYAKDVVAVERDSMYAAECRLRGLRVLQDDLTDVSFTGVDVIYFFLSFSGAYAVTRKIQNEGWHGTVISHFYPLHEIPGDYWKPHEVIHSELPFLIYHV